MVKLEDLRKKAAEELKSINNLSPLSDIDYILKSLGFSKTDIILGEKTVEKKTEKTFLKSLKHLKMGEPVQYIVGKCEFMSLDFNVNKSTLIPRCDTEILVEEVIRLYKDKEDIKILEVGTGSGCIAISLAKYLPKATVVSIDISKKALKTAKKNALRNSVGDRVKFIKCDIKNGFPKGCGDYDVVVSNPPYIPSEDIEGLEKKVKNFEPISALDGGGDGLDFYRIISKTAPLKEGGLLAFEVGFGQARDVSSLMDERFKNINIIKDLSGIDRVVTGMM